MVRTTGLALVMIGVAGPMVSTVDAQTEAGEAVAIVVHPEVAIDDDNLTLDQLRSIFLAERQHWGDRSRITLLVRAAIAPERDLVLTEIYGMSEDRYRQYWIGKMFRSEVASGPKIVFSTDMLRDLVTVIPGSIGFVPVSEVGPDLKVIRIDGMMPGDEGYPLN